MDQARAQGSLGKTDPLNKPSLQSRNFLEEKEEEELPRASISCLAGPGPNTKVKGFYNLEPTLTDADYSHEKPRPEAEPGGLLNASTGASAGALTGNPVGVLSPQQLELQTTEGPRIKYLGHGLTREQIIKICGPSPQPTKEA